MPTATKLVANKNTIVANLVAQYEIMIWGMSGLKMHPVNCKKII
jgi:hypothetical protein